MKNEKSDHRPPNILFTQEPYSNKQQRTKQDRVRLLQYQLLLMQKRCSDAWMLETFKDGNAIAVDSSSCAVDMASSSANDANFPHPKADNGVDNSGLQGQTKDGLRAELCRLQRERKQNDTLLDALSSTVNIEAYNIVTQGLKDRTKSRNAIFCELVQLKNHNAKTKASGNLEAQKPSGEPFTGACHSVPSAVCPHCHSSLGSASPETGRSSSAAVAGTRERNPSIEAPGLLARKSVQPRSILEWIFSVPLPSTEVDAGGCLETGQDH